MSIGALDAAAAYGRTLGTGAIGASSLVPTAPTAPAGTAAPSFGAIVENMVSGTAQALHGAEAAAAQQVSGHGDLIDVVTAMSAAETALETVVAVRDRVVSAYGEIMRMQI